MSGTRPAPTDTPCGTASGCLTTSLGVASFDPLLEDARATWMAGDFGRIALGYAAGAEAFVGRLGLAPGERVLDVACGTGNLAIPAARSGARVTGLDIAPNLVDAARSASSAAALDIRFDVGTAESLPYSDGSFDTVMSMFGVMYAARPDRALWELVRVTRRNGRIALASWTPQGFVGSMLRAHTALVPPRPEAPNVLAWGHEAAMRRRFEAYSAIRAVDCQPRAIELTFPLTPGAVVELLREFYGPTARTFAALDARGRAALGADLLRLWASHNTAPPGSTSVIAEYLEIRIQLAR